MAICKNCVHFEVCKMHYQQKCELTYESEKEVRRAMRKAEKGSSTCEHFKDSSKFIELPMNVKRGDKLWYFSEDRFEDKHVCELPDTVTAVMKEGFFVSTRINKDLFDITTNEFYEWSAIGTEYFLTKEEAEHALKKREINNDD